MATKKNIRTGKGKKTTAKATTSKSTSTKAIVVAPIAVPSNKESLFLAHPDPSLPSGVAISPEYRKEIGNLILSFMDMAVSASGQETHYNSKEDQQAMLDSVVDNLFVVNRGLLGVMLSLPGLRDIVKQKGLQKLLWSGSIAEDKQDQSFLSPKQENRVIAYLIKSMLDVAPQRVFKMYEEFRVKKINNRRTRWIILSTILNSSKIDWWAVKYRSKIRDALTHAWGSKTTSYIRSLLEKPKKTSKEIFFLSNAIDKYMKDLSGTNEAKVYQSIAFVLGANIKWSHKLFVAFEEAKTDLTKGAILPPEVLEGIRSVYHKDVPHAKVFELTKNTTMTEKQKLLKQVSAKKAGVDLEFDAKKQDPVDIYVYALERGNLLQGELDALMEKAKRVASVLPFRHKKVGMVFDNSKSMCGSSQGKKRPLAVALAMRDVLCFCSDEKPVVKATNGMFDEQGLIEPVGDTSIPEALLDVLESGVDCVYILSDGYENAPAGRTHEVVASLRNMGIETPIIHVVPGVVASEAGGVRRLSPAIEPLPVYNPAAIGLGVIRTAISVGLENGIKTLVNMAQQQIGPAEEEIAKVEQKSKAKVEA